MIIKLISEHSRKASNVLSPDSPLSPKASSSRPCFSKEFISDYESPSSSILETSDMYEKLEQLLPSNTVASGELEWNERLGAVRARAGNSTRRDSLGQILLHAGSSLASPHPTGKAVPCQNATRVCQRVFPGLISSGKRVCCMVFIFLIKACSCSYDSCDCG